MQHLSKNTSDEALSANAMQMALEKPILISEEVDFDSPSLCEEVGIDSVPIDMSPPAGTRKRESAPAPRSLLRLRTTMDWTQSHVAGLLRVDTRTVQKWENGTARMPWASWALLNVMAGMSPDRLRYL